MSLMPPPILLLQTVDSTRPPGPAASRQRHEALPQHQALTLADGLRNSLSAMIAVAYLLENRPTEDEQARTLGQVMRRQIDALTRHIEALEAWSSR